MTNQNDPQPLPAEQQGGVQVDPTAISNFAMERLATKFGQAQLDLAQSEGVTQALAQQLQEAQQEIARLRGLIPGMGEDGEEEVPEFPDHKSKTSRPKAQR